MSAESESRLVADYLRGRGQQMVDQVEDEHAKEQAFFARAVEAPPRPKPRVHMVSCTRLPGNCCWSCHEDEDLGYDNLYWDDVPIRGRTDLVLGEYHCCAKSEQVKRRIDRMAHRLAPKPKPCGCACNCHDEEHMPYWPGPCAGCCDPYERYECDCTRALREAWGWAALDAMPDEDYPPD